MSGARRNGRLFSWRSNNGSPVSSSWADRASHSSAMSGVSVSVRPVSSATRSIRYTTVCLCTFSAPAVACQDRRQLRNTASERTSWRPLTRS
jgi:hypothetical protein